MAAFLGPLTGQKRGYPGEKCQNDGRGDGKPVDFTGFPSRKNGQNDVFFPSLKIYFANWVSTGVLLSQQLNRHKRTKKDLELWRVQVMATY
uniref:Uncharacterized protein n=1 Tax=Latilactobacillus curvatus TaxID=28038 RepID=Q8VU92_LATCU|nr:hypothetical protein [Latilactobacillus curvatus]AAL54836.1 unknown [Latilactobacillus curvatus]